MKSMRKRVLLGGIVAVIATSTLGIGAASAADIPCTPRALSKAFAQFGDMNDYFVVADGTFENGTGTWRVSGPSAIANQQAPWKVNGAGHTKSLTLGNKGTAQTRSTCVNVGEDWMRFFYKASPGKGTSLTVTVTSTSDMGTNSTSVVIPGGGNGWLVSPAIAIPNVRGENFEQDVTITFKSEGRGANWQIDDVMIDPFKVR